MKSPMTAFRMMLPALALLHFLPAAARTVTDTVWYNAEWKKCAREEALYFRTGTAFRNGLYHVTDRHLNGITQMTGTMTGTDPDIREGIFLYYDTSGALTSKERYVRNKLDGTATRYFAGTGKVARREAYRMGQLHGASVFYDAVTGSTRAVINWKEGKATGTSKWYSAGGKLVRQVVFRPGQALGAETAYDTSGAVTGRGSSDEHLKHQGTWRIYFPNSEAVQFELTFRDDLRDGPFKRFDYTCNNILTNGYFKAGQRDSIWQFYNGCDTGLVRRISMRNGKPDGPCILYDPKSGMVLREGQDSAGREEGEWRYYFPGTTQLSMVRHYHGGKLNGGLVTYFPDGKIRRKEVYEDGTMMQWSCYGTTGADTIYYKRYHGPEYPEDYQKYFNSQIVYPEAALGSNLEGKVIVLIHIDAAGRIYDDEVVSSTNRIFDSEAERVALTLPIFAPGRDDGQPVEAALLVPVTFRPDGLRAPAGDF